MNEILAAIVRVNQSVLAEPTTYLFPVMAALISAFVAVITTRIQFRGKPENSLIDQLQEELKDVRKRIYRLESRDRVYLPHILRLNQIIERMGGTAPDLPGPLQNYLDEPDKE
jgi:cobalamin biosynthesis protein CobD/CbiB